MKMKKSLCILLAAILLAASLSSCSASHTAGAISANIRTTSSDAADAAAWLAERLGDKLTDRVVLGTDADGYAVDVSALEDDGYVIRALGGETALFARTIGGLDRAVRKYAKTVESGAAIGDESYHEGYRVKALSIAGNDISKYAIVRVSEDDPCVTTAANTLAEYIEKACGTALPVCGESGFADSGRVRKIAISSGDETLGSDGYTITVDEAGDLHIDGGKWRGSLYGAYDVLEDIGWRFIGFGSYSSYVLPEDRQECLYEAESVDLTAELDRTEIPSIPIRGGVGGLKQRNTYSTRYNEDYGGYGFNIRACHGLQNNHDIIFSGEYEGLYVGWHNDVGFIGQPCFTNEDILEAIDHYALWSVKSRLDAGQKIGKEIIDVDVAQWDGGTWTFCRCKTCTKVLVEEGCHTGAFLRMANRVARLLDENYPGVSSAILAYAGTDQLPRVTRPEPNVFISFCYYYTDGGVSCQNHCISGVDCQEGWGTISNRIQSRRLEEWCEVTDPKMMQIWYYPFVSGNNCYNTPLYGVLLDDMHYFASLHIEHVYYCMARTKANNNGLINETLTEYLGAKFMWDADMTKDEGLAVMREWFELAYGKDAGGELFELAMFAERAGDLAGCWCSFDGGDSSDRVNYEYVAKHADEVWDKAIGASALAEDAAGEEMIKKNAAGFMFMVVRSTYDDMYLNGTAAERELITERYRTTWERMSKYGLYAFDDERVPETFDPEIHPKKWLG